MAKIDAVGKGIYRIRELSPAYPINFIQFPIDDEQPALIHTGMYPTYEEVRKAVAEILDPSKLRYVVVPHFEADECGGMERFVEGAKKSSLVCSEVGAAINLNYWDCAGPVKGVRDGDVIDLGRHKLRFLETPHVHHWDSMMVFEETEKVLFSSDLFIQPGDQPTVVSENLSSEMCHLCREVGIFASEKPVRIVVNRIEKLNPEWIHPMHGGSLPKASVPPYISALRNQEFAFNGKLLGRVPGLE
jgi:flavorubredoxin